jgi:hypothetical protein
VRNFGRFPQNSARPSRPVPKDLSPVRGLRYDISVPLRWCDTLWALNSHLLQIKSLHGLRPVTAEALCWVRHMMLMAPLRGKRLNAVRLKWFRPNQYFYIVVLSGHTMHPRANASGAIQSFLEKEHTMFTFQAHLRTWLSCRCHHLLGFHRIYHQLTYHHFLLLSPET